MPENQLPHLIADHNEDYTGAVCLLHKLTGKTPAYEELLVDNDDFERISQFSWSIQRVGRSRNKYAVRDGCIYLAIAIMNPPKGMIVDHIFHNTLDNRRSKLRVVTVQQSNVNVRRRENGTSKYKGVYRCKSKWYVLAGPRNNRKFLGSFDDEVDAAKAYNRFAESFYGSVAYLNPV